MTNHQLATAQPPGREISPTAESDEIIGLLFRDLIKILAVGSTVVSVLGLIARLLINHFA